MSIKEILELIPEQKMINTKDFYECLNKNNIEFFGESLILC